MELSRKEKLRQETRELILGKALELFVAKGYSNVTIREIAQATEISTGGIYNYFSSKEEILDCLREESGNEVFGNLYKLFDFQGDSVEVLRNFIRGYPKVLLDNILAVKFYFSNLYGPGDAFLSATYSRVEENAEVLISKMQSVIQSGIEKGLIKQGNARNHALVLLDILDSVVLGRIRNINVRDVEGWSLDDTIAFVEAMYFNGVLAGGEEHA